MGGLFSAPKVASMAPSQQITAPSPIDYEGIQAAKDAAEKKRKQAAVAKGAASTILTGGMGLADTANTEKKKLFGE